MMSETKKPEEKNAAPAATPPKPAKKLQPRVAAKPEAAAVAKAPPAKKVPVKKVPVKKPSKLDETKARNKKALAEALAKAQAVQIPPPPAALPEMPKAGKPAKAKKVRLVRHSISMPESEYAQIAVLKKRIADFGGKARRSELVRAGIAALVAMDNVELTAVMARVERIKPGRPAK